MKIVIAGGTGFVGRHLIAVLLREGHDVVVLSRSPQRDERGMDPKARLVRWDGKHPGEWVRELDGADTVITLAGKSIFTRWTEKVKKTILGSRVHTVRLLLEAIQQAQRKPSLFISASAIGYYGDRGESILTEDAPAGNDFLAEVCVAWEAEVQWARTLGIRIAIPRLGIVLGKDGGALQQMIRPFRFFLGGYLGSGRQWFPWIHLDDVIQGILYPLHHPDFSGIYNLCAPHPLPMKQFTRVLGRVLHRPSWIPVPVFVLRLVLGEAARMLLNSHRAIPERLLKAGFAFRFPTAEEALEDILR